MQEIIKNWDGQACPKHGTPVKKEYSFSQYRDATVTVFKGCRCAVCVNEASLACGVPLGDEVTWHPRYADAAGRAELIKAKEYADNAPFH